MQDEELKKVAENQTLYDPNEKKHRFGIYNFVVFTIIATIIWLIGQFTPGIPDEQVLQILGFLAYIWYGIHPIKK